MRQLRPSNAYLLTLDDFIQGGAEHQGVHLGQPYAGLAPSRTAALTRRAKTGGRSLPLRPCAAEASAPAGLMLRLQ